MLHSDFIKIVRHLIKQKQLCNFNTSFNDLMIGGYRYQLNQGSHQAEQII